MITVTCIEKLRDKNGNIKGYVLQDNNGVQMKFSSEQVKQAIFLQQLTVDNLKLTSDGKLINNRIKTNADKFTISGLTSLLENKLNYRLEKVDFLVDEDDHIFRYINNIPIYIKHKCTCIKNGTYTKPVNEICYNRCAKFTIYNPIMTKEYCELSKKACNSIPINNEQDIEDLVKYLSKINNTNINITYGDVANIIYNAMKQIANIKLKDYNSGFTLSIEHKRKCDYPVEFEKTKVKHYSINDNTYSYNKKEDWHREIDSITTIYKVNYTGDFYYMRNGKSCNMDKNILEVVVFVSDNCFNVVVSRNEFTSEVTRWGIREECHIRNNTVTEQIFAIKFNDDIKTLINQINATIVDAARKTISERQEAFEDFKYYTELNEEIEINRQLN